MSRTPREIQEVYHLEETAIKLEGDWSSPEAEMLSTAWLNALALNHKLPDWVKHMDGMSGRKYRYLINNLVEGIPDARYLEIGSWAGSTACSAIYGNNVTVTCIDDWSHWGGPKEQFLQNVKQASTGKVNFQHLEGDFRSFDYSKIGKYNVYLFDGPHMEEDQYDGIELVKEALDDLYFLIIDDYNWSHVRKGTEDALKHVGHKVVASITVTTWIGDGHPIVSHQFSDWHDGYFIALVSKK